MNPNRPAPWWPTVGWLWVCAVLACLPVGSVVAQPAADAMPQDDMPQAPALSQTAPAMAVVSPRSMLRDQLMMLSSSALAGDKDPRPDQTRRAAILLDMAVDLTPNDPTLLRARIDLARIMDDQAYIDNNLQHYCNLVPEDDAAQLDLVMRHIKQVQTLDGRLAAVQRFMDSKEAANLSPALRSRLASFGAEAAREFGDNTRAASLLSTAVTLDPANIHAAQLRLNMLRDNKASDEQVGLGIAGLMRADPLDPLTHEAMGELLMVNHYYDEAGDQYDTVIRLQGADADLTALTRHAYCLAAAGLKSDALTFIQQLEDATINAEPADKPLSPQKLKVPLELEMLRAAIYESMGDTAKADGSFGRMMQGWQDAQASQQPPAESAAAWLCVLFNRNTARARKWLDGQTDKSSLEAQRIAGWLALRAGKPDEALAIVQSLADLDPACSYATALISQQPNNPTQYRAALVNTVKRDVTGYLGAVSAMALASMPQGRDDIKPTAALDRLLRVIRYWPSQVVNPQPSQNAWTQVSLDAPSDSYKYLEPNTMTLTYRNASRLPLSIGPDGVLPTRAVALLIVRKNGLAVGEIQPVVIDLDRRLTLAAQESFSIPFRVDRGALGLLTTLSPDATIDYSVHLILDPVLDATGRMVSTSIGASTWRSNIQRVPAVRTPTDMQMLIAGFEDPDPVQKLQALGTMSLFAAGMQVPEGPDGQSIRATLDQARDGVNRVYPKLDPVGRAWVVRFITGGDQARNMFGPILEDARRSTDRLIRVVYLATQVTDAQSPDLDAAQRSDDAVVVAFANALRESLKPPQPDATSDSSNTPTTPRSPTAGQS
ncbi:MAG: hypothetical protein GC164_00355 [Phycisphaera sp.]|nr:hypothetical protein [Phycisphaera sp.]